MGTDKIGEAIAILELVGMPRAQLNERSALTLLALLDLKPENNWTDAQRPLLGVTPIMDWMKSHYRKTYAPNTRETIRRQTLHQMVSAGLVLYNPDKPDRAVNSPHACYQVTEAFRDVLRTVGTEDWGSTLGVFLTDIRSLRAQYAKEREMVRIPVSIGEGEEVVFLSAGDHSQLIKAIIEDFAPRFAPGARLIYVGDTGAKGGYFKKEALAALGVTVDNHGKMPDVVLYWAEKNWLFLVESVTSHGPVDGKRYEELSRLFGPSSAGLIFVTAFPNKKVLSRYIAEVAWETEIWLADNPTHMLHLNGERFLGPY